MSALLQRASRADAPTLRNLFQLYIHDFSEFWADSPPVDPARGELGEDGRFADYPLDSYWRDAERHAYLIRSGEVLAGFALVNRHSHSGAPVDQAVAEFFIARKHRRAGLGLSAAHALFATATGQWEAAVARRNTAALAFWRRAANTMADAHTIEIIDVSGLNWDGPIVRFRLG